MTLIHPVIIAIDPGRQKCGIALVDHQGQVIKKQIVASDELVKTVEEMIIDYPEAEIVLGDRTASRLFFAKLKDLSRTIHFIDEDRSSLEGRYRYLKENTKGLAKLLPIGLRVPNQPFDDYVAVILAERFLKKNYR